MILYISVVVSAGVSLFLAASMRKNHRENFLNSLFYLVLFFNIANFFSIVWNNILIDVLKLTENNVNSVIYFSLQNLFLLIPIYLILIYFLIKAILEMGGRIFPERLKVVYLTLCGLYLLLKLYFLAGYLRSPVMTPFQMYSHWIFWILVKIALLVIPLTMFLWKSQISGDRIRLGVLGFGFLFFTGMAVVRILDFLGIPEFYESFLTLILIIPPLLYLQRQLRWHLVENADIPHLAVDLSGFFEKYHITPREAEIIQLVAQGKSNGQIADTLYLSEQTIKQHIHSIYKKLDVKNRVQLSNLVRNSLKP